MPSPDQPRRSPGRWPAIVLACGLLALTAIGLAGLDFGYHWDEWKLIDAVKESAQTGLLLPRWYNYPSLPYDLCLAAAAPQAAAAAARALPARPEPDVLARNIADALAGSDTYLRTRAVFLLLSLLAALPIQRLTARLTGSPWTGVFAGLAAVSAWEFVYHARWIAPDCLLVLAAACSLPAQYRVLTAGDARARRAGLAVSALFAGLAIGAKYTGGILLLPMGLALFLSPRLPGERPRQRLAEAILAGAAAALVFVITTPGCVLEPIRFALGIHEEMLHYARGHGGSTVAPGADHLGRMLSYLGLTLLSKKTPLAAAAAALALGGAVHLARRGPRAAVWLLALPVAYIAYMSSQRVMLVRNYLVLLPYLAVLAGLGLQALRAALDRARGARLASALPAAAASLFVAANIGLAGIDALHICRPSPPPAAEAVRTWVRSHPERRFYLSPACAALVATPPAANVAATIAEADHVLFSNGEISSRRLFPANRRGRYGTVWQRFDEVNWDYYPSWSGHRRILDIATRDPDVAPLLAELAPRTTP